MDEPALAKVGVWQQSRFWVGVMLLVLAVLVVVDRWFLCSAFLFKYFDQDQALLWYAAQEFLHGRFHEPCFYGQDYNTCIESYLAAPLLICGVPYWVALPLVTVVLGLLPFYLMAWMAWRRGQELVAGLSLLVPLILPVTYSMITGMPRGFVPGLAMGIVPAVWILSTGRSEEKGKGRWFGWRYFWMAVMGVLALVFTANAVLLLFPMLIYGVLRNWKRIGFWTGTIAGTAVGGIYPAYIYAFYHVWHDDYWIQHRDIVDTWSFKNFQTFIRRWPGWFGDLVPMGVDAKWAAGFLLTCAIVVVALLLVRRKWGMAIAAVGCLGLTLASCGYSRLIWGTSSVFYPLSRMFLAVPVVLVWALLAAGPMRKEWKGWKAWLSLVLVGMMVGAGSWAEVVRHDQLPEKIQLAITERQRNYSPLYPMEVGEFQKLAKAVQWTADREHADMVLFVSEQWRKFDYCLPLMTNVETLFTVYERRTWRMYEENHPRHERIIALDEQVFEAADSGGYHAKVVVPKGGPLMFVIDTKGESVLGMCDKMGIKFRAFDRTK